MAKNKSLVLLGYDDDPISEKQKQSLDFKINKFGGKPNWPNGDLAVPACPICGLKRPLILQIYAPLDGSQFHRTLYIFSCVNASCSNQSKGWLCVRSQQMEKVSEREIQKKRAAPSSAQNINWCSGADEWDDEELDAADDDGAFSNAQQRDDAANMNEQNGNFVCDNVIVMNSKNDNSNSMSEDEEESNSMESDPIPSFGNLQVVDDKNANCGDQGGAVGRLHSPNAYAEIEGEESELITIDAPIAPERDLIAMLKQTTAVPTDVENLSLKGFYIAVEQEYNSDTSYMSEHVLELMQEYEARDDKVKTSPTSPGNLAAGGAGFNSGDTDEKYEKGIPAHGDLMFHNYLTKIQENPGQILRYSRDTMPLLIAPLQEPIPKCQNCGGDALCEIQVLPTLISKLRFLNNEPVPIEYGNVLIYTCKDSCWDTPDKMRLEHIIVQQEV